MSIYKNELVTNKSLVNSKNNTIPEDPFRVYSSKNEDIFFEKFQTQVEWFEHQIREDPEGLKKVLLIYFAARQAHLNELFNDFFKFNNPEDISRFMDIWAEQKAKLETVGDEIRPEDYPSGGITVCVPIVITEPTENIERLFEQIKKNSQDYEGYVRLVFWVNYRADEEDAQKSTDEARKKFQLLKERFAGHGQANIYLEMALDELNVPGKNISLARTNYMSALLSDVAGGRFDLKHPVLWLDADTTYLSPNTLSQVSAVIQKNPTRFVHPDTEYSLEWLRKNPAEWDVPSTILLIDEMARRTSKREKLKLPLSSMNPLTSDHLYPEESGMAFNFLTYLMSGGIVLNAQEESYCLRRGLDIWRQAVGFNETIQDEISLFTEQRSLQAFMYGSQVFWIFDSKLRISARRTYLELCAFSLAGIPTRRSESAINGYQLFSESPLMPSQPKTFTLEEIEEHLSRRYTFKTLDGGVGAEKAIWRVRKMMQSGAIREILKNQETQ